MAVTETYKVKVFDNFGVDLLASTDLPVFKQIANHQLGYGLNGIETYTATFYLDDPQLDPSKGGDPTLIRPLDRVLKVWREIYDDTDPLNIIHYKDPDSTPCFSGNISRLEMQGFNNQVTVLAQCPYWRLQSRYHIADHLLVIDYPGQDADGIHEGGNMDGLEWDVSALAFRLVDLVNHAFGPDSATGIVKPPVGPPFWEKTVTVHGGYRAAMGNIVWIEINELFWIQDATVATPDLVPEYIENGTSDQMYFKTAPHRGSDISASVKFNFCTQEADPTLVNNLDDFKKTTEITVDDNGSNFANYLWAVGQAGPEASRRVAQDPPSGDPTLGHDVIGLYMYYSDSASWADRVGNPTIQKIADGELLRRNNIPFNYEVTPSPLTKPYFITNDAGIISGDASSFYHLGDVAAFNANKGMLQVSGDKQRIYEVNLTMSETCVESTQMNIAKDFFGKVPVV